MKNIMEEKEKIEKELKQQRGELAEYKERTNKVNNEYLTEEFEGVLTSENKKEYAELFSVDGTLDDGAMIVEIEKSMVFDLCRSLTDTMKNIEQNKENIRSFMKLYKKDPKLFNFITPDMIAERVFMVPASEYGKVGLLRLILENELKNENIEILVQIACLCFIHPSEIMNEYISEYSEPLKNMIFQSLIFILLNDGNKENIKIIEDICNILKMNGKEMDLMLFQEKLSLLKNLGSTESELFGDLLDMNVQPLSIKQEKLTSQLLEKSIKPGVSKECVEEEKQLLQDIREKKSMGIDTEKILFLKQCSREREKSMELLSK